jgi:hypothetical protein
VSVLALAAACTPLEVGTPAAPRSAVPAYVPSAKLDPPASGECKSVLLAGDSLMLQARNALQTVFADHGYCADVRVLGVPGSAPAGQLATWMQGRQGPWTDLLRESLDQRHYDAVVAWFQGNSGQVTTDQNMEHSYAMVDVAKEHGVPMWWTLPPLGAAGGCNWSDPYTLDGYERYRTFVFNDLVPDTGVKTVDGNVLTPLAGPSQQGPAEYNDQVRFPNGKVELVRDPDCLHLTGRGGELYAREVLIALQGLWNRDPRAGGQWSSSGNGIWPRAEALDDLVPTGF